MDVLPLNSILVPVDFTEPALNALAVAVQLSRKQAEIHLVYVLDHAAAGATGTDADLTHRSHEYRIRDGADRIRRLAMATEQAHQVRCSSSCRSGKTADEVIAVASQINADLIVTGTQNGTEAAVFRLGADAYQLIKTVSCPVLTVPVRQKWTTFERILFPVRPIRGSLDKYAFTRKLIQPGKTEVIILALCAPDEVISMHQLRDEVTILTERLAQDEVKSQTLFLQTDSIAETVLEKVDELAIDLLVVTASLNTTTDNFFMGPFTQQIVYNSRIPVLAIRPESALQEQTTRIPWQYDQTDQGFTAIDF